jgi:thiopeptide-type bacteriocin biosynthesis protein
MCPEVEEDVLLSEVAPFATRAVANGLAENWFFLRYGDPQRHLRVRWKGPPHVLNHELLPLASEWSNQLVMTGACERATFDTYERELERYGGHEQLTLLEGVFGADSEGVIRLLEAERHGPDLDRTLVGVASVRALLTGLGLKPEDQEKWAWRAAGKNHETGKVYRRHKALLMSILSEDGRDILGTHRAVAIADLTEAVHWAAGAKMKPEDLLDRPLLIKSLVHLHCNRLLPSTVGHEEKIIGLLAKATAAELHKSRLVAGGPPQLLIS